MSKVRPIAIIVSLVSVVAGGGYLLASRQPEDGTGTGMGTITVLDSAAVNGTSTAVTATGSDIIVVPRTNPSAPAGLVRRADSATDVEARRDRPLIAALAPSASRDARMMGTLMTAQNRDSQAKASLEADLRTAFAQVQAVDGLSESLNVTCVATACEVTGKARVGVDAAALAQAMRDPALERTMLARRYTPGPLTVADAGDGRVGFSFYLNNGR